MIYAPSDFVSRVSCLDLLLMASMIWLTRATFWSPSSWHLISMPCKVLSWSTISSLFCWSPCSLRKPNRSFSLLWCSVSKSKWWRLPKGSTRGCRPTYHWLWDRRCAVRSANTASCSAGFQCNRQSDLQRDSKVRFPRRPSALLIDGQTVIRPSAFGQAILGLCSTCGRICVSLKITFFSSLLFFFLSITINYE